MDDWKDHVGHHEQGLPAIGDPDAYVARCVPRQVDQRDTSNNFAFAINGLQGRIEASHVGGEIETILNIFWCRRLVTRVSPVLNVPAIDIDVCVRKVDVTASNKTTDMILMHMRDYDRINGGPIYSTGAKLLRKMPGLAKSSCRSSVDQNPLLAVINQILIEEKSNSGGSR
jgi:hypothetical protein